MRAEENDTKLEIKPKKITNLNGIEECFIRPSNI